MILIVDDESGVRVAFGRVLEASRIASRSVGSLAEARAVLDAPYSGFILDIFLPDGTGVDLLAEIRARPAFVSTPVAVITADILLEQEVHDRITALGAKLHHGVFNRADIEMICLSLLTTDGKTSA